MAESAAPVDQARLPPLLVLTSTFPRWADDNEPPFVLELSRRLTDRFAVTVLAPRSPGSLEAETLAGLRVIRFPYFFRRFENLATHGGGILNRLRANRWHWLLVPPFLLGQLLALIRLLRREDWAVIHAHWPIPQGLIAVLARFLVRRPVPLVCTSHGGDLFALRGPLFMALKHLVLRASTRITVVSAAMRALVLAQGIAAERVQVLPMGVDLQGRFTPDPATPREPYRLLFVGRLVEKKGVALLLRALPAVLEQFPETRLSIAGGGPLEPELRRLARDLGLADRVEFLGMQGQAALPNLYRRATLFVAPFLPASSGDQEGFPVAPMEALGCGCPLVCGDIIAFGDLIRDSQEAALFPPGDVAALAGLLVALLGDPARRDALAARARQRGQERFDWRTIADAYGAVLASAARTATATSPSPRSRP